MKLTALLKNLRSQLTVFETPYYLYDEGLIKKNVELLKETFSISRVSIFFAVKANTSVSILKLIRRNGIGAEVVSPGEIFLCLKAGFKPKKILYNNIARKESDVKYALKKGVVFFNFEAVDQAQLLEKCAAEMKKKVKLFVRVNPAIFHETHPHLSTGSPKSKFGVEENELKEIANTVKKYQYSELIGIHSHIGSQILNPIPFVKAAKKVMKLVKLLRDEDINIKFANLGGGFGVPYHPREKNLDFKPIVDAYKKLADDLNVKIFLEPGRFIVCDAGYVITKVISSKRRNAMPLYVIDASMTENPRPAIYQAYHHIEPLFKRGGIRKKARVVGPLCENSDEFGAYNLPVLKLGDFLIIHNCGAYARSMVSNYNGRLLAPEYSFDQKNIRKIRNKQKMDSLVRNEKY